VFVGGIVYGVERGLGGYEVGGLRCQVMGVGCFM